jgi:hypothetical protein
MLGVIGSPFFKRLAQSAEFSVKLAYDNDNVDVTELLSETFAVEIMREFLWMNKGTRTILS